MVTVSGQRKVLEVEVAAVERVEVEVEVEVRVGVRWRWRSGHEVTVTDRSRSVAGSRLTVARSPLASAREDLRISADGGCEAAARTRQQLHRTAQIIPFKQMGIGTGFRTRCSLLTFRKIFRVFFLILKFSPLYFPSYSFYRYRAEPLGFWEVTFSKYKHCKFTGTCVLLWLV